MASLLPTGKSYERLGNFPLDSSSIKSTLEEAIDYASNNPTAYHGQIIFIVDARTQDEITSNVETLEILECLLLYSLFSWSHTIPYVLFI